MPGTIIETKGGKLRGQTDGSVCSWKGIPYATAARFTPPERSAPWQGVRDATAFGRIPPQPSDPFLPGFDQLPYPQGEDCLSLNVWAPERDGPPRPVMVWIHGGAYVSGSGAVPWYDGTAFARDGDLVVVTLNYRLGALGFLRLWEIFGPKFSQSANLGILDQIAALRWVQENIAAFGGDPSRVTIFGESAGAGSVGVLLAAPAARGLFAQAIMQSGSGALLLQDEKKATETARRILKAAGVAEGDEQALRSVDTSQLVDATATFGPLPGLGPVVDGDVLPKHPLQALLEGSAAGVPLLTGVNRDEFRLFTLADPGWFSASEAEFALRIRLVAGDLPHDLIRYYLEQSPGASLYERLVPLLTHALFGRAMLVSAQAQVAHKAPVWVYRFDFPTPVLGGQLGACHALEIPFVFDTLDQPMADRFTGDSPERQAIADAMHWAWIGFARGLDPDHHRMPHWPQYGASHDVMAFGVRTHVETDPWAPEQAAWSKA